MSGHQIPPNLGGPQKLGIQAHPTGSDSGGTQTEDSASLHHQILSPHQKVDELPHSSNGPRVQNSSLKLSDNGSKLRTEHNISNHSHSSRLTDDDLFKGSPDSFFEVKNSVISEFPVLEGATAEPLMDAEGALLQDSRVGGAPAGIRHAASLDVDPAAGKDSFLTGCLDEYVDVELPSEEETVSTAYDSKFKTWRSKRSTELGGSENILHPEPTVHGRARFSRDSLSDTDSVEASNNHPTEQNSNLNNKDTFHTHPRQPQGSVENSPHRTLSSAIVMPCRTGLNDTSSSNLGISPASDVLAEDSLLKS